MKSNVWYPHLKSLTNKNLYDFFETLEDLRDAPPPDPDDYEICFAGFWGCNGDEGHSVFHAHKDRDDVWVRLWLYPQFYPFSYPYMVALVNEMRSVVPSALVELRDGKYYLAFHINRKTAKPRVQHVHILLVMARWPYEFFYAMPKQTTFDIEDTMKAGLEKMGWKWETSWSHMSLQPKKYLKPGVRDVTIEQYVAAVRKVWTSHDWLYARPTDDYGSRLKGSYDWSGYSTPTVYPRLRDAVSSVLAGDNDIEEDVYDPFA